MTKSTSATLAPPPVGVKKVPVQRLSPNPHNPRLLFDRLPLETLKASIQKVGILVPLTVYWDSRKDHYVILDGQRRWMCARDLGMTQVPVNVVKEPTLVQNIVTMFQIHKLREDWELMPTALKLEVLMDALEELNERRLAELTGLDVAVVSRCKKLLSYPKRYQDKMLFADPDERVKSDFFIELYAVRNDRLVNSFDWFVRDRFTQQMLNKYQDGSPGIRAVTDFRIAKQHINNARRAHRETKISRRLKEFAEDKDLPVEHLQLREVDVSADARKLASAVDKLVVEIKRIDVDEYFGEERLWKALEDLERVVHAKLQAADRRAHA